MRFDLALLRCRLPPQFAEFTLDTSRRLYDKWTTSNDVLPSRRNSGLSLSAIG